MRPTTLDWHSLRVGDALPDLVLPLSATHIVAGAIATRDFMPVHHDPRYAQAQGSPDIFMNILTDTGYCSRFLTDWAGPNVMIKRLAIRLGVPAFPGSTLTYSGSVASKSQADGEGLVEVAFRATNDMGDHVSGTAVLSFLV